MFTEHTENQKYVDYLQPLNQNVCALIHTRMESIDSTWYKKKILDYGCNNGHLLRTSRSKILQENYLGIDVQIKPLDQARTDFPNAQFIHYDGYHVSFNPTGQKEFPIIGHFKPEIIVCHGVFTHCDITSILETLDYFKSIIMPNGYIIFSLWEDCHLSKYIDIFLEDRLNITVPKNIADLSYKNSYYLINRNDALIDQEKLILEKCDWIETFYRREYIKQKIPNLLIPEGLKSKHTIFVLPT
jgi:2-polyprenyl-3-methyl-5-hydroxy-6-metoxy-1,4-benzoquinol methylase